MNNNAKNLVCLAIGVAIAVVYMLMPAQIYEAVKYFDGGYSNELYNYDIYPMFAMLTVAITWGVCAVYYYVINSVKFDRWPHWLIMLITGVVLSTAACVGYNSSVFASMGLEYHHESLQMAVCHVLFAALMFVVATFSMRWWSSNCRHSPF